MDDSMNTRRWGLDSMDEGTRRGTRLDGRRFGRMDVLLLDA